MNAEFKVLDGTLNIKLYDDETGEVINSQTPLEDLVKMLTFKNVSKRHRQIREQVQYFYEDKIMIFQKMLGRARKELNGMELRVFIFMLEVMDFENWINVSQKDIAKEVGMSLRKVQDALKGLRDKDYVEVIRKGRENYYRVNPEVAWKGSEKSHFQVLKGKNPKIK